MAETQIEFNSNQRVIDRTNDTIRKINQARDFGDINEMSKQVVNLYKEIDVDLNEGERKVWEDIINLLRLNVGSSDGNSITGLSLNKGRLMSELDNIDIVLRRLAKKHGYLTSNKDDPRKAILRR